MMVAASSNLGEVSTNNPTPLCLAIVIEWNLVWSGLSTSAAAGLASLGKTLPFHGFDGNYLTQVQFSPSADHPEIISGVDFLHHQKNQTTYLVSAATSD